MGSPNDPKGERPLGTYTVVNFKGREVKLASDDHQPGAAARSREGIRLLGSVHETARKMKERDADRK